MCSNEVPRWARSDAVYCSSPCRQAAYRLRKRYDAAPEVSDEDFARALAGLLRLVRREGVTDDSRNADGSGGSS